MTMSEVGGDGGYRLTDGKAASWTGMVMMAVVLAIAAAITFVFFFHLYTKWYLRRHRPAHSDNPTGTVAVTRGLALSILRSLPVVSFKMADFKDGLECSVCLCEVSEGESARLLPDCKHGFHLECIDMWFQFHSTCPLCRCTVSPAPETVGIPANVLFCGSEGGVNARRVMASSSGCSTSSSSSPASGAGEEDGGGKIVIDVARQCVAPAEESPVMARLRSFRKLFSSTREGDLEQGMATP